MLDRLIVSLAVLVVAVISNCACLHVVIVEHRISVKSLNACGHGKKKKKKSISILICLLYNLKFTIFLLNNLSFITVGIVTNILC